MLNACKDSLYYPLCLLYSQSLDTGILPAEWKQANISPIFKSGVKQKASNYRPINLTSHICKVLSIIKDELFSFLL